MNLESLRSLNLHRRHFICKTKLAKMLKKEELGSEYSHTSSSPEQVPACRGAMQVAHAPAYKQVILVAVKASANATESVCSPLRWVLDKLARPGDEVVVLAALQPSPSTFHLASDLFINNMRERTSSASKSTIKKVHGKLEGTRKEIESTLSSLYENSLKKNVKVYLDVRKGKIKALGIGHAMMLKATHIVIGRELKMYRKHFIEHLPCIVIQMRRNSPPYTFQGVQFVLSESNDSDFDDLASSLPSRISTSQSSPRNLDNHENLHIPSMNSEFFTIELPKRPLDYWAQMPERPLCDYGTLAKLNGYAPFTISTGSGLYQASLSQQAAFTTNDLADALRRMETRYSTSGQMTRNCGASDDCSSSIWSMGHALPYEHPIASSATSRSSSFKSLYMQCNNAELPTLEELENTCSATKDRSSKIDPTEIQENVKEVIAIEPSKVHASHLVDSLLIEEGLTFDDYSVSSQEKQLIVEHDNLKNSHQQQASDVSKSRSPEERIIAESATIEYAISPANYLITLQRDEEHLYIVNEGRKSSALACPFCSVCKQSPVNLGKRPIEFSHDELSFATDGFSWANLLGGDDAVLVYKGMLKDGHHITIKKFKEPCVSGDADRLFEVQLLMCAQHRNLVMLLGFCTEDTHFMLVYEHACNKSLSWHLAKKHNPDGLQWWARRKIAFGVARALRYLHEECRGGCIVHRDIRADSIYLTHEFVPMVGNFGLACLQQDEMDGYAGGEAVSWKIDVYAFGVVLLELITGKQALDNSITEHEQQSLVDWAQPVLLEGRYYELVDSRLESSHDSFELICMVRAALLCITSDPSSRPRMGQVMRILEGGNANDDEPRSIELSLSDELPLLQCDQLIEAKPKAHHLQSVTSNNNKPHHLQSVTRNNKKPKRKFKGPSLTYSDMLH